MKIQIHQSGPSRAGYVFPLVSGDAGVCIVNPTQPKLAAAAGAKKKHQSRPLWWRARNNLHNATCRLAAHTNAGVHLIIQVPIGKRARARGRPHSLAIMNYPSAASITRTAPALFNYAPTYTHTEGVTQYWSGRCALWLCVWPNKRLRPRAHASKTLIKLRSRSHCKLSSGQTALC